MACLPTVNGILLWGGEENLPLRTCNFSAPQHGRKAKTDEPLFPWWNDWPPAEGVGNPSDETRKQLYIKSAVQIIDGYDDGFHTTAPVMKLTPNKLGAVRGTDWREY